MVWEWLLQHGLKTLETIGVVSGLFYTGWSIHRSITTHRVSNLLSLTQANREIRTLLVQTPNRLLDASVNLDIAPVEETERHLVSIVIQHYFSTYYLALHDRFVNPDGLRKDLKWFFSFPIPSAVWHELAMFQRKDFKSFVESIAFD